MTFSTGRTFCYFGGALDLSWLPYFYLEIAPDVRRRLDLPGPKTAGRRSREVEGPRRGVAALPAAAVAPGARGRRARLLRVARPPGRRALLGLPAHRGPLRPGADPGAEPLRLARRGLRADRRRAQLRGHAAVGRPARDRALDARHADAAQDARGCRRLRRRRGPRLRGPAAALLRPRAEGRPERARPRGAGADLRDGRQRLARRARNGRSRARGRRRTTCAPPAASRASAPAGAEPADGYVYDPGRSRRRPARRDARALRPEPARRAARTSSTTGASRSRATSR